jgi:hypothetical protein
MCILARPFLFVNRPDYKPIGIPLGFFFWQSQSSDSRNPLSFRQFPKLQQGDFACKKTRENLG